MIYCLDSQRFSATGVAADNVVIYEHTVHPTPWACCLYEHAFAKCRTPDAPTELLFKESNEPDSGWLDLHTDDMRRTVTEQLQRLFAPPRDESVKGRRAAAGAPNTFPHQNPT